MNLLFWGVTLSFLGKMVLGVAVLRVHLGILKEHKIDNVVLNAIRREQVFTLIGIGLIVIGYALEAYFYSQINLFSCEGTNCAATLIQGIL
jgi:hypothetical protein